MPYAYPTWVLKTSVYLPDELKTALAGLSQRWGRSEADLIRMGLERLVASSEQEATPARVVSPPKAGPRLTGIGVGPGAADLLTQRACAVLANADRVFAPTTALDAIGRAETIVREAVPQAKVERLVFVMQVDSPSRDAAIRDAAERILEALDRGEHVAFITLGDPNIYSTFSSVAEHVAAARPSIPIDTVAGIMAFQELASRSGTVVVDGNERLSLVTLLDDARHLDEALADADQAVVLYKGGRHLPEVAEKLRALGRLEGAVVGELLGLPGERMAAVADVADRPASYLATVIVPPKRSLPPVKATL
jgi:precorrin-2/cobalt-factor-2 C20-methyltransferase